MKWSCLCYRHQEPKANFLGKILPLQASYSEVQDKAPSMEIMIQVHSLWSSRGRALA